MFSEDGKGRKKADARLDIRLYEPFPSEGSAGKVWFLDIRAELLRDGEVARIFKCRFTSLSDTGYLPPKLKDIHKLHERVQAAASSPANWELLPETRELMLKKTGSESDDIYLDLEEKPEPVISRFLSAYIYSSAEQKAEEGGGERNFENLNEEEAAEKVKKIMDEFAVQEKHYRQKLDEAGKQAKKIVEETDKFNEKYNSLRKRTEEAKRNFETHIGMAIEEWKNAGCPTHEAEFKNARLDLERVWAGEE